MQIFIDELVQQATDAGMNMNGHKTKEILFSSILKDPAAACLSEWYTCGTSYDI